MKRLVAVAALLLCVCGGGEYEVDIGPKAPKNVPRDEGSKESPVELGEKQQHWGAVSKNGASYYKYKLKKGPYFKVFLNMYKGKLSLVVSDRSRGQGFLEKNYMATEGESPIRHPVAIFPEVGVYHYFYVTNPDDDKSPKAYNIYVEEYDDPAIRKRMGIE